MIGQTISHYRIVEKIGAGGMGDVYRAHDELLDRDVALKVLSAGTLADEGARRQFHKEALALAKLNHPIIETVHEFSVQDGVCFLVMELIPGCALSEKLKGGPLSEKEVLRLGILLAEGLAAAHGQGVVHRDLKPGNLMLTPDGRLKILDFGLAKLIHPEVSSDITRSVSASTSTISGTLPYMPPEQLRGLPVDPRCDIYAAGAVMYELVTGQRPFPEKHSAALIAAILHDCPAPLKAVSVSVGLERIILKTLEKEPSLRYQSAHELRVALEGLSSGLKQADFVPPTNALSPKPINTAMWRRIVVAMTAVLTAVLVIAVWIQHERHAHTLRETDTVLLADFANSTGDPSMDDTLKQALSVELAQSPFLNILTEQTIRETMRMMGHSSNDRVNEDTARQVCLRTGGTAVLTGSIARSGGNYIIGLDAVTCASGESIVRVQARANGTKELLPAISRVSLDTRRKLGESLPSIRRFDTPIEQATTESFEALEAYSQGVKIGREKGDIAALPFFKRAIELDPNFVLAYAARGVAYSNLGEPGLAGDNLRKAFELRDRVTERERLRIAAYYYTYFTGELAKANDLYRQWASAYPRDYLPYLTSAGNYASLGQYDKAVEVSLEAVRLHPNGVAIYANLVNYYAALNHLEEAKNIYNRAIALRLDANVLHANMYGVGFLEGDATAMEREVIWATANPGAEDMLFSLRSDTEAFFGHLERARDLSRRAVESARRNDENETAATWQINLALRESEFGNLRRARADTARALALMSTRDVQILAALTLARTGDWAQSEKLAEGLAKRFPLDTMINGYWLPTIRAAISITRNRPSEAAEKIQVASPYELGTPQSWPGYGASLYPIFVRGQALLLLRRGADAEAEFQKFIDHRNLVGNCPLGSLARLGLARSQVLEGNIARARTAYRDFFTVWKDADPDIPILKQAKAEYAKLQ
jgi:eukaryotic-like serine/threonine-protein kinase